MLCSYQFTSMIVILILNVGITTPYSVPIKIYVFDNMISVHNKS